MNKVRVRHEDKLLPGTAHVQEWVANNRFKRNQFGQVLKYENKVRSSLTPACAWELSRGEFFKELICGVANDF
jgi:hypothetical protein